MPRSRSFTRLTMRVGLLHLGQSVDFVVSITFLRSPVLAILAIGWMILLLEMSGAHTHSTLTGKFDSTSQCRDLGHPECAASTARPGSPDRGRSWLASSSLHQEHIGAFR